MRRALAGPSSWAKVTSPAARRCRRSRPKDRVAASLDSSSGPAISPGTAPPYPLTAGVKAASGLYAPVAGRIAEVNEQLASKPELINSDPYGEGWILKLELAGELPSDLLDEAEYKKVTEAAAS